MLTELKRKDFANGTVYLLETEDGFPIETTDTFLPFYTKNAIGRKQNLLANTDLGSRNERWMIGISTMSGCPVKCKFCATGQMKKYRRLTATEITEQVMFVLAQHPENITPREFKVNYTRMGEPFLNIIEVKKAIKELDSQLPYKIHHYLSTIGIKGSDFHWIRDNITLQFSVHSFDEERRTNLIPFPKKMSLDEMGAVRTTSNLKTTVNLTLVDKVDFDINELIRYFPPDKFFIKLSPINPNQVSEANNMGTGIITSTNLV